VLVQAGRHASVSLPVSSALSCGGRAIQKFNMAKQQTSSTDLGAIRKTLTLRPSDAQTGRFHSTSARFALLICRRTANSTWCALHKRRFDL
jgi:hypothetical protein